MPHRDERHESEPLMSELSFNSPEDREDHTGQPPDLSHTRVLCPDSQPCTCVQLLGSGDSEAHARTRLADACSRLPEEKLKSIIYRHVDAQHPKYFWRRCIFYFERVFFFGGGG